jgi:HK97 family phage major capsid protein
MTPEQLRAAVKDKMQLREFLIEPQKALNEEDRTLEIAFSSEEPYERWWGTEILDHTPDAVNLKRLRNKAPFLSEHNRLDQIGVLENAWIDRDKKGRAVVRFSKKLRAQEEMQDVKDGIRTKISVAYMIHEEVLEKSEGDHQTWRITKWEPLEVSLVSIPADDTVGVGRSATEPPKEKQQSTKEIITMPDENNVKKEELNQDEIRKSGTQAERARVQKIMAMAAHLGLDELAKKAVKDGTSASDFAELAFAEIRTNPDTVAKKHQPEIGLTPKEARQFSFLRAINALADPTNRQAQEAAAFEFEVSRAAAKKYGQKEGGILVPWDVLRRDLTAGTATGGAEFVATEVPSDFIDVLRNASYILQDATVLRGLQGDLAIPKIATGATAYWVAEGDPITESTPVTGSVPLAPHTLGAWTDISRKFALQSSVDAENLVRSDIAKSVALEIDRAALHGTGSNDQPKGVAAQQGIGSVIGGAAGAAPDWADIIDLESAVAVANADLGNLKYYTNAKVRGKLKKTVVAAGTSADMVWDYRSPMAPLNGYDVRVTNQVASNLVKGGSGAVCSAIFFGNWADLLVGMWGNIELTVNPYALQTSGGIRVVALADVDIAVRHVASFAAMLDALTA